MSAQAHYPTPKLRISQVSWDLLAVLAVPLSIYLLELRFGLVSQLVDAFDAISVIGIQGDELLLVLSSLGFMLLFYSIRRQTETRRAELALQQSGKRFRALIENSSDGIVLLDPRGNVLYRSPASERMLGNTAHGGLVANVFEIVHPDDLTTFQAAVMRILSLPGENVTLEYRARHGDGSWRWLEAVATNLLADPSVHAVVANYRDITDRKRLADDLQRSNIELSLAYDTTLEGWSRALDLRDHETEGHSLRVTEMTLTLAHALGLGDAEMLQVRRGALLHDIGKMGVPDSILLKPGPLSDAEWIVMRKHPAYAYQLLSPIQYLHPALDIPYCHHERWDGAGYPRGLKGEQIPLTARIFSIVDVWDALCSDRPYRAAWPAEKVRAHIRSLSGTHFDPQVVDVFLSLMPPSER